MPLEISRSIIPKKFSSEFVLIPTELAISYQNLYMNPATRDLRYDDIPPGAEKLNCNS